MKDKIFELLMSITDNDTLIIVGLFITMAFVGSVDFTIPVATGLLGYMKGKGEK